MMEGEVLQVGLFVLRIMVQVVEVGENGLSLHQLRPFRKNVFPQFDIRGFRHDSGKSFVG